ncbi:type IX secretion system outer membrane channel protein PorV [Lutimonas zeaxanthinifaciens]|uniref:type IX secretion system outer membrane channel protein PorV n=1 Tax=Lutimonas zeaxanthinifaciens TaxID=3060215 RepID=UPI00265D5E48|nr:type IX secretion system outer membrane channel protein PorV [Lutimonas sp. YSD2104]WKK66865.1 type IX secretion system outer membrane channel protein PorV [Lutimonas sp. YSD2104]
MKKLSLIAIATFLGLFSSYAQDEVNPITTAAPFLLIAPDARAGGLADMGGATSSDASSLHYNAAKYAFSESQWQIGLNYTPWLRNLTNDVSLTSLFVSNKINERSAWATSLTYFSLGSIELTDGSGISLGSENPNEFAIDGAYSLKLSEVISMAVGLRFIHSDLAVRVDNSEIQTVNTFAVDVSMFYQSEEKNYNNFNGRWRAGVNISNIGPKVELVLGGDESFIPTNLKMAGGFDFILDNSNTITANLELNKLLVPTPPIRDNATGEIIAGRDDNVNFLTGMVQSWYDAPRGFEEEMEEFIWAVSGEYLYNEVFSVRAGYFHESANKGNRQFFTLGTGFKFRSTTLDVSYLINASDVNNPLESTLRFSLTINLGDSYAYF